jgi:hypothetical protein
MPDKGEKGTDRRSPGRRDITENVRPAVGQAHGDSSDLASRERRDMDGPLHRHARPYERDHPGKSR